MSMIGTFGICPKDKYDALMRLIQHDGPDKAENLIKEIYEARPVLRGNIYCVIPLC